jgi:hypothetical protein
MVKSSLPVSYRLFPITHYLGKRGRWFRFDVRAYIAFAVGAEAAT